MEALLIQILSFCERGSVLIMKSVTFSAGGISLVLRDLSDLLNDKIKGMEEIVINTSSHPNSSPHLGTLTTISTAFLLARKFQDRFSIPARVEFDELENSPAERVSSNYYKSLGDSLQDGRNLSSIHMDTYNFIFEKLSALTSIPYDIRTYMEYQSIPIVRGAVIEIYRRYDEFRDLLDPSLRKLFLRTKCPICSISNRDPESFCFVNTLQGLVLYSDCCIHGKYEQLFSIDNSTYIDMNTQLRDLTKGVLIAHEKEQNKRLIIMCDGRDWSGEWALRMHCEGMRRLGYNEITTRFFSPTIVDWSGGKYSKSVYLRNSNYTGFEDLASDFNKFYNIYGDRGFSTVITEVSRWVDDPIRFYRNYSNDYFKELLG